MNNTIRWLDVLAIGVVTYQMTQSAIWVSSALFLRLVPMFVLGAFVGAVAERINRRRLLMGMLLLLAAAYLALGTVAIGGQLRVGHVLFGCVVSGIFWAIEIPARRTMMMEAVGLTGIGAAMGVEMATQNLTRMLGPLLGGLLLERAGVFGTYWLTGLLCLSSLGFLWGVTVGSPRVAAAGRRGVFEGIRDGFRFIHTDRLIQSVLFCTIAVNLFGFSYITLVPVIGEESLGLTAFPIGLLMSAEGAGAFVGALLIVFFASQRQFHRIFFGGAVLFLGGVLSFSMADSYPAALASLLIGGIGIAGFSSMQSTLILSQAPEEMRNRMLGVMTVCIGFAPAGVLGVGLLAYVFYPRAALSITSVVGLLLLALAAIRWPELPGPRGAGA